MFHENTAEALAYQTPPKLADLARRHFLKKPLALLILGCSVSIAQTPDTATLRGFTVDQSNRPVQNAQINILDESLKTIRSSQSDSAGGFSIGGLPSAHEYSIYIHKEGFTELRTSHLRLAPGSSAEATFTLRVAGESSTVIVKGSAGDVRIDQPQLGTFLSREHLVEMPVLGRKLTFIPLLNAANRPAINQGDIFLGQNLFNTNGAGRRQAWFEVDGANAVDLWGRQTIFSNIPMMAIGEMTVLTNAYTSEYGSGVGGVENIVTRSGGTKLGGEFLELWRPAATGAALSGFSSSTASSGNQITGNVFAQSAASLYGPAGRSGKTHFFLAGEWNREAKASPITSPIAPGSFVGHYRGWLGFLRLDRQISKNNFGFARVNFDGFSDTNPNGTVGGSTLPSVARNFRRRTLSANLGATSIFGPHLLNNTRIQFQLASPVTQFEPVVYGTQFSVPITSLCGTVACGTFTSGTSQSALLMNRQYEASDSLSYMRQSHQLIVGTTILAAHNGGNSKEFGGPLFLGKFTYNPCSAAPSFCESAAYLGNINNVANYQQSYGNAQYNVDDQLWSLFALENYRIAHRLTISGGLRYERQSLADAAIDFAPRAGVALDIFGNGAIVFRGGYGIYYSQIIDNSVANYALGEPGGVFTYTATPGQLGFPSSINAAPLPAFPAGAAVPVRSLYVRPGQHSYLDQFFPTSTLKSYPSALLNPYTQQFTASVGTKLGHDWVLDLDYVGAHTIRNLRPLDIDSPATFVRTAQGQSRSAGQANCTRPYWVWWYVQKGIACQTNPSSTYPQPPYSVIQTDVNNGYLHYNALDINLSHAFSQGFSVLGSYAWSQTLDNVDPDTTNQNPNDPNLTQHEEYGPAIYDQRHRFVLSGFWILPLKLHAGGILTMASAPPFNYVTGSVNSGDAGATTDRPVLDGAVVGRNAGRGRAIYAFDPFLGRSFPIHRDRAQIELRIEAFNVLNHHNFVGYSGTYGNGSSPPAGFGAPLPGVTSQLPARSIQLSADVSF